MRTRQVLTTVHLALDVAPPDAADADDTAAAALASSASGGGGALMHAGFTVLRGEHDRKRLQVTQAAPALGVTLTPPSTPHI